VGPLTLKYLIDRCVTKDRKAQQFLNAMVLSRWDAAVALAANRTHDKGCWLIGAIGKRATGVGWRGKHQSESNPFHVLIPY
jgi:hypothetical protein